MITCILCVCMKVSHKNCPYCPKIFLYLHLLSETLYHYSNISDSLALTPLSPAPETAQLQLVYLWQPVSNQENKSYYRSSNEEI